jgi:hypothetical protein
MSHRKFERECWLAAAITLRESSELVSGAFSMHYIMAYSFSAPAKGS